MLELDETLFVEHKKDIGKDSAYKVVQAVAAFANTLGGWLLIGVEGGKPTSGDAAWADAGAPTLVDTIRDRLRGEIDPLPTFEAKVLELPDGRVGVVRVYESADTPHVLLRSGAVFVREVAGVADASGGGKPGSGAHARRRYEATQIRSRAQLLELAERGRRAKERVAALVDPAQPLQLINEHLGLVFEQLGNRRVQPRTSDYGRIFVRLVPYTLLPRFRGWSTTADASASVLSAAEVVADRRGLDNSWSIPHPAGAAVRVPLGGVLHSDGAGGDLNAWARVVVDGAGLAAAALELEAPQSERRAWMTLTTVAEDLIAPTIRAAADVLEAGDLLGRAWCQIDLAGLGSAMLIEGGGNTEPRYWVPTGGDLTLPLNASEGLDLAQQAANAYGRSAGIPAWDRNPLT